MEPTILRWSAKRKVELLLALIKGEKKLVDACREYDLKQSEECDLPPVDSAKRKVLVVLAAGRTGCERADSRRSRSSAF